MCAGGWYINSSESNAYWSLLRGRPDLEDDDLWQSVEGRLWLIERLALKEGENTSGQEKREETKSVRGLIVPYEWKY